MSSRKMRFVFVASCAGCIMVISAGVIAIRPMVIETYYLAQINSSDRIERVAAIEKLGEVGSVKAIPELIAKVSAMMSTMNQRSFGAAEFMRGPEFSEMKTCDQALMQIVRLRRQVAIEMLATSIDSPQALTRRVAVMYLGMVGPDAILVINRVQACMGDADEGVREAATAALKLIDGNVLSSPPK